LVFLSPHSIGPLRSLARDSTSPLVEEEAEDEAEEEAEEAAVLDALGRGALAFSGFGGLVLTRSAQLPPKDEAVGGVFVFRATSVTAAAVWEGAVLSSAFLADSRVREGGRKSARLRVVRTGRVGALGRAREATSFLFL